MESIGTPELHEGSISSTSSEKKNVPSDMTESKGHSSTESGQDEASRPTSPSLNKGKKRKCTNTNSDDKFGELLGKIVENQKAFFLN